MFSNQKRIPRKGSGIQSCKMPVSADAGESAERPYQLVTVYERHGRHVKRSTQSPLPRDLHVEFKLDMTPVEFHLRRNARVHRKIPVTFEGDNRTLFVTIDEVNEL